MAEQRGKMGQIHEFHYISSILCKYENNEGEARERSVQGREVDGTVQRMMQEGTVDLEV